MKRLFLLLALVLLASPSAAQTTKVTPLLSRDLTGIAGKEGSLLMVEYPNSWRNSNRIGILTLSAVKAASAIASVTVPR